MFPFRLIACDIDGTLSMDNTLSLRSVHTLQKLQQQGVSIVLCSGRSYPDVLSLRNQHLLALDMLLLNSAMQVNAKGQILHATAIKKQSAKMILQMLQKEPIAIGCYDETHIYSLEEEDRPSFQKHYLQSFTDTTPVMSCFKTIAETDLPKTILKIELLEKDEEKRQRLQTRLSTLQEVKVTTSGWDNLEITSPLVSKGTALQTYVAQHGFTKEEVLVFGDSENDLSMFSCFPNSVAVANACTQIKNAARYHCKEAKEDGVAQFLEMLIKHAV